MSKQPVQKHFFHVLTLSLVIILMGGGVAFLYQWYQGATPGHATSSDSVVGPPSLPASLVNTIFRQMGSPMAGTGQAVEAASRAENIDDAFALAVWWTETNDGEAGVGLHDLNPGSVRGSVGYPSAYDGYTIYPSFTAAVHYWFGMLKKVYIDRGLTTVYAISHPYVGTSTSDLWAGKVTTLMQRYRAEAPPRVTPTPTVSADMKRVAKTIVQNAQQRNAGGFVPVPTPQRQNRQQTSTTAVSGLEANAKQILVLFDLLLALALGMWGWSINRRYSRKAQPRGSTQSAGNVWEQLRASQQQPATFFNTFSGQLPMTGGLATGAPNTESLVATSAALPTYASYTSGALPSLGTFTASQAQFREYQTPQLAFTGAGQFSQLNEPEYPLTGRLPASGLGLPSLPARPVQHPPYSAQLPDTDQLWQTSAVGPGQQPVGVGSGSGRANGLLSRYRDTQTQGEQRQR